MTLRVDSDGDGSFDTVASTATTAGDGDYVFSGLAPGRYLVVVIAPSGMGPTGPAARVLGLATGEVVTDVDVGLATPAVDPPKGRNQPAGGKRKSREKAP